MSETVEEVATIRFDPTAQGEPGRKTTTIEWHADESRAFRAGFWAATLATYQISYDKDELCVLLEGTVRLTNAAGVVAEYSAGETFLVPKGFRGTWENVGTVRKFFAIHKPPA